MMIKRFYQKRFTLTLLALVFAAGLCGLSFGGTVVIKPGQFDHLTLQIPDKIVAGENFLVKVQAYDLNKNLIANFIESGKEFKVDISGSAAVQPSTLNALSFSGGSATISVNSKKAEKLIISIRESGGTVPVISRELVVSPNKLEHFVLQVPSTTRAGARFDMRIIAKDLFDNTVDDTEIGRNLKITASGTANPLMISSTAIDFKNGTATATFVSDKAGVSTIELQEITGGSRGKSNEILVNPGPLSNFRVQAPKSAVAGEAFELMISAYDVYDNLITNYNTAGAGVSLLTTGSTKIEPSSLAPFDFKNGQAVVRAIYEKAEDIVVIAKDVNSDKSGKTVEILVGNASPDHFVVVTPDVAVSGQRFKIKIEAYDRFNNIVRNYNIAGNEVLLSTSGTSVITPSIVLPTDFINGIAMVEVTYDRAESFTISARMIGDKRQAKITVSGQDQQKEPLLTQKLKPTDEQGRKEERPFADKKTEKYETKKETPAADKKPVAVSDTKRKEVAEKTIPKTEHKPAEQKHLESPKAEIKKAEVVKPVTPKTEHKVEKPVEIAKAVPEAVRKEDKKPELLTAVSKIAAIEARNKAMLVINLTDVGQQFSYSDTVETRAGKEWLRLTLKPAVRKTDKSFKFKSSFMGDVLLEEDKTGQNILNVFIELPATGVTFDIERIKNTLIVTLSRS